ncbi:MAG: molybdopterin-dependent oxidoreductase [Deltaproteobacteria bacterium]|nr:molybdopterin-dependent oxidoreductase [Deltaproteobacteria bacterium]
MARGIDRRAFLKGSGALVLSLNQLGWVLGKAEVGYAAPLAGDAAGYAGFEDLYRKKWSWDKIAKSTHFVNCWYQRNCSWNVYVKNGIVWREEQSGTYEQVDPNIPDFNPRGCQKGACYSQRMYDAGRLTHPLKRVGKRGEGKWKRISWDQALDEIADKYVDVVTTDGPGAITWDPGTTNAGGGASIATHRLGHILDTPLIEVNTDVGDHHPGAQTTVGKISFSGSMDDFFYSDLILIWGGNPVYTQIPNAHFINEARYNGAEIVAIAPDYNASSVHADTWIGVNPGSDAALGLSLSQVIISEGLQQDAFIREQTDLPLLVRSDNQLFLRGSDMEEGGNEELFYVFDESSEQVQPASKTTLALEGLRPALEGEYSVDTREGPVKVTPVFHMLRKQVDADFTPEQTAAITGVHPDEVRKLARQIAKARAAVCVTQSSFSKYYHGIEMERCQILVLTLCGQIGKKGSGITGFPALAPDNGSTLVRMPGNLPLSIGALSVIKDILPTFVKGKWNGKTDEAILYEVIQDIYRDGSYVAGNLFYYHVGLQALYGSSAKYDPSMKRELKDFLEESYEKGWQIAPAPVKQRIFFEMGGNILRRARGYDVLERTFAKELDLLVTLDWRMSNTALHSDYVLPAAGWYEKDDILWATPLAPYIHIISRAVEPIGDSKADWTIHCLIARAIQEKAKERNALHFTDRAGNERRLDQVYDNFTFQGMFNEDNPEAILQEVLERTENLGGIDWATIKEKGFQRVTGLGMNFINIGNATDIEPNETITANTWHTDKKLPWPTLTGRIQFYIDHPYYLEQGEQLPVHKDSPKLGGDYPLQLVGAHTRWSIHAAWRDNPQILRLGGRGEPTIWIGNADAAARGIRDHDRVRVYNDISEYETLAKIVPSLRPGEVIVYHAWEPYQFKNRKSYGALTPNPINPLSLAGGYTHLQPLPEANTPGPTDRDTRVEVEKIAAA